MIFKIIRILLSAGAIFGAVFLISADFCFAFENLIIQKFSANNGTDLVQIFNPTESDIDLSEYVLKDSTQSNQKSEFNCFLKSNSFYSISFSNFLNIAGDTIRLYKNDDIVDCVCYGNGEKCVGDDSCVVGEVPEQKYAVFDINSSQWLVNDDSSFANNNDCNIDVQSTPTLNLNSTPSAPNFELYINELMPNPDGNDTASKPHGEWIEIFNPSSADIAGFYLLDEDEHRLEITGENSESFESGKYIVVYKNSAGFSLNNDSDYIMLMWNDILYDDVVYDESESGKTISKINDSWCITDSTKGRANSGCVNDDEENIQQENQPTSTPTTKPTIITPIPSVKKILGATTSATATPAAHLFYDLFSSSKSAAPKTENSVDKKDRKPLALVILSLAFFSIAGAVFFYQKQKG